MQIYYLKEFTLIGIEFEKSTKKHAHLGKKESLASFVAAGRLGAFAGDASTAGSLKCDAVSGLMARERT